MRTAEKRRSRSCSTSRRRQHTSDQVEEQFNATHDDIHLTIDSPNDASTIMRTRFIREDYPDIIGIGGDINYSYYVDAEILADVSEYEGMENIKDSYVDIAEALEIVPTDGTYIVPYMANAPVSCITEICLRNMAGKFLQHG